MAYRNDELIIMNEKDFEHLHALATAYMAQQAALQAAEALRQYSTKDSNKLLVRLHEETAATIK